MDGTLGDIGWIREYVYLLIFVVNGDTCTFGDVYFGENNEAWLVWMWFYDLLVTMAFLFILWNDELYSLSWLG